MLLSMVVVSVSLHTGELSQDPSLYVAYDMFEAPFTLMTSEVAPLVIDEAEIEILWDDQAEEFSATISSGAVHDLVTGTTAEGYPSFEGKFTPGAVPTLHGWIQGTETSYTIYVTFPGDVGYAYHVTNSNGFTPVVSVARTCDCTDSGSLDCGPASDCTTNKDCGDNEGKCEFTDVAA